METQCNPNQFYFQGLGPGKVVGRFDGGTITSDAGALLLCEVDRSNNFFDEFSSCFVDYRDQRLYFSSLAYVLLSESKKAGSSGHTIRQSPVQYHSIETAEDRSSRSDQCAPYIFEFRFRLSLSRDLLSNSEKSEEGVSIALLNFLASR